MSNKTKYGIQIRSRNVINIGGGYSGTIIVYNNSDNIKSEKEWIIKMELNRPETDYQFGGATQISFNKASHLNIGSRPYPTTNEFEINSSNIKDMTPFNSNKNEIKINNVSTKDNNILHDIKKYGAKKYVDIIHLKSKYEDLLSECTQAIFRIFDCPDFILFNKHSKRLNFKFEDNQVNKVTIIEQISLDSSAYKGKKAAQSFLQKIYDKQFDTNCICVNDYELQPQQYDFEIKFSLNVGKISLPVPKLFEDEMDNPGNKSSNPEFSDGTTTDTDDEIDRIDIYVRGILIYI